MIFSVMFLVSLFMLAPVVTGQIEHPEDCEVEITSTNTPYYAEPGDNVRVSFYAVTNGECGELKLSIEEHEVNNFDNINELCEQTVDLDEGQEGTCSAEFTMPDRKSTVGFFITNEDEIISSEKETVHSGFLSWILSFLPFVS